MKKLVILSAVMALVAAGNAQIVIYSFNGNTMANSCDVPNPNLDATTVAANMSAARFARVNIATTNQPDGCIESIATMKSVGTTTSSTVDLSSYLEFSLTPDYGYFFHITGLRFRAGATNANYLGTGLNQGADSLRIGHNYGLSSCQGMPYLSQAYKIGAISSGVIPVITANFASFYSQMYQPVVFRIYPYKTSDHTSGTLTIDTVEVFGTVEHNCEERGLHSAPIKTEVFSYPGAQIFPNPSPGIFTLTMTQLAHENSLIDIMDLNGKPVKTITLQKVNVKTLTRTIIDLSAHPDGMYLCRISSGKTLRIIKIIKE